MSDMPGSALPKVSPGIAVLQDRLFVQQILQHFGPRELMAIRPVCRLFRDVAERYLWTRHTSMRGVSSVVPAQGTKDKSLYRALAEHIASNDLRTGSLRIASDQITDTQFFRDLLGPILDVRIRLSDVLHTNVGSVAPAKGRLPGDALQVKGPSEHGKAHTKFISGGGAVAITSSNLTYNALSGGTVESGVIVHNPQVQAYFNRYWDLMRGGSAEDGRQFKRMLEAFNMARHPMRLALAPFVEVQPWLLAELDGFDCIVIRMFLISHLGYGADIVSGINAMARRNPAMQVSVYVDTGQHDKTQGSTEYFSRKSGKTYKKYEAYVQVACQKLMWNAPNVRVFKQARSTGIMHDKLILAQNQTVEGKGADQVVKVTRKRAILGSSGFSTHVMHNANFDLMVAVENDGLYDYLMSHHQATLRDAKTFPTVELPRT